jgi:hypothetical protein
MRFIVLIASLPAAFAFLNPELCNGAGACVGIGVLNQNPFRCPDGSSITIPIFGNDLRVAGSPNATPVSKGEFPKTCYQGAVPGPNARLVVCFFPTISIVLGRVFSEFPSDKKQRTSTSNGQTAYSFVTEDCRETKPAVPGDCYHYNTNPST